jgi:pyrroloquinoline quinone (PQQ) biosynthesis protein C
VKEGRFSSNAIPAYDGRLLRSVDDKFELRYARKRLQVMNVCVNGIWQHYLILLRLLVNPDLGAAG